MRVTPLRTEIIIKATRTQNVLGACACMRLCLPACMLPCALGLRQGQQQPLWAPCKHAAAPRRGRAAGPPPPQRTHHHHHSSRAAPDTRQQQQLVRARRLTPAWAAPHGRRREGAPHPRADLRGAEAVQVPGGQRGAVRGEGGGPGAVRRGAGRVPALQAAGRPGRAQVRVRVRVVVGGAPARLPPPPGPCAGDGVRSGSSGQASKKVLPRPSTPPPPRAGPATASCGT